MLDWWEGGVRLRVIRHEVVRWHLNRRRFTFPACVAESKWGCAAGRERGWGRGARTGVPSRVPVQPVLEVFVIFVEEPDAGLIVSSAHPGERQPSRGGKSPVSGAAVSSSRFFVIASAIGCPRLQP